MHGVIGFLALIVWFVIWYGLNQQHVKETGVPLPSRRASAKIRRNSREKGITQQAAYEQWVSNKQKKIPPTHHPSSVPNVLVKETAHPHAQAGGSKLSYELKILTLIVLVTCAIFTGLAFIINGSVSDHSSSDTKREPPSSNVEAVGASEQKQTPAGAGATIKQNSIKSTFQQNELHRANGGNESNIGGLVRLRLRSNANVRATPDAQGKVAMTLPRGSDLNQFAESDEWVKIGRDKPLGWVHRSLVKDAR